MPIELIKKLVPIKELVFVICQVHPSGKYISMVILPPQHYKSLSSMTAILFTTHSSSSDATNWIYCLP